MEYRTAAQQECFEKIVPMMKDIFGELARTADDRPSVLVMVGSALAVTSVYPWGGDDATITTRAYVLFGAELTQELLLDLLQRNDKMRFGAFGVDNDGDIFFEHTIVGSTCDRDELKASVLAVGVTADGVDEELAARYGGQTPRQRAGI